MEVTRLPFNQYAYGHLRAFEACAGLQSGLSKQFEAEINKPIRAIYLGVYDQARLVGCARVVSQSLGTVLLDSLQALPSHPRRDAIEEHLLQAARSLAAELNRPLGVIAERGAVNQWTQLGFRRDPRELLTLPVA